MTKPATQGQSPLGRARGGSQGPRGGLVGSGLRFALEAAAAASVCLECFRTVWIKLWVLLCPEGDALAGVPGTVYLHTYWLFSENSQE